ncbi:HAD family hydrolase [Kribbella deserti]|uniref:HAD family hydrolase n=1 Tax=Kribbella deserti TaxID=1926257 RepID=A0ABV6QH96_9ACTN
MPELIQPSALLLDFGGVVVSTAKRAGWADDLARAIHPRLGSALSLDDVRSDIEAGASADSQWKNAMSRPLAPRELTHAEFWADFVAADWPAEPRAWVTEHATELCRRMGELRQTRTVRPGMAELLDTADDQGLVVAIVSNALSGQVHRDFLEQQGLSARFALQVYSDEAGVRKPNPEMIGIAVRELDVSPGLVWYVGDNFDRDVVCGCRAGAGATILMEAKGTYDTPFAVRAVPDAVVADPYELRELLLAVSRGNHD